MRLSFDLSLYLVTDRAMTASRGLVETVRAAAAGGATIVQLRDKEADDADLVARARALVEALAGTTLRVIVNDRADIAAAAVWLASPAGSWVTGQNIVVAGGA